MSDSIDVKQLRKAMGWSQKRLAEHLGLDRSSVSRLENRKTAKGPTKKLLEELIEQRMSVASDKGGNTLPEKGAA